MKKEYIFIGAVALTIGYFIIKNKRKSMGVIFINDKNKNFPKKIDISKIKEYTQTSQGDGYIRMSVVTKESIYDDKYVYIKVLNNESYLLDKENKLFALYDSNGFLKKVITESEFIAQEINEQNLNNNSNTRGFYEGSNDDGSCKEGYVETTIPCIIPPCSKMCVPI